MTSLKILQVVPTLYPTLSFGGGSIVAWELGLALKKAGDEVSIISTDAGDGGRTRSGRLVEEGMNVHRVRNLSNSLAYQFKLFLPMIRPATLRDEIRKSDVVHMHDFRTFIDLMAGKMAIDEGKPLVVQPHGTIRGDYVGRRGLKRLVDSLIGNRVAAGVVAWIALSESEKMHLVRFGIPEGKVRVVPNGIDLGKLARGEKEAARKALGIDARKKVLLFIGRIHPIKGLDLLLDCLSKIADDDLMAIIAGPDDGALPHLKDKTKRLGLSDRVVFKGVVSGVEKANLLNASDAFVLPSEKEAFPISILEACAAGLPVITTRNSDIAAEIDGVCGLAVERTESEFSQAIIKVMRGEDLAKRFISSSREYSSRYSWEKVVGEYIKLYESVLRREGAGH